MRQYKQRRKIGIGSEGCLHKQFGSLINKYTALNKLNCVFWSYSASGEKRTITTASLLKAKGLQSGQPDYHFIKRLKLNYGTLSRNIDHTIYLEFKKPETITVEGKKSAKGKQSDNQKAFEARFKDSDNSRYYVVHSVDEALRVLEKEGILLTNCK